MVSTVLSVSVTDRPNGATHVRLNGATFRVTFSPSNWVDGRGAWSDNVFVERLWRSVKYEEVYLNAYESMAEAKSGIGNWIEYYNHARKHQTLGTTPELMYAGSANLKRAA